MYKLVAVLTFGAKINLLHSLPDLVTRSPYWYAGEVEDFDHIKRTFGAIRKSKFLQDEYVLVVFKVKLDTIPTSRPDLSMELRKTPHYEILGTFGNLDLSKISQSKFKR